MSKHQLESIFKRYIEEESLKRTSIFPNFKWLQKRNTSLPEYDINLMISLIDSDHPNASILETIHNDDEWYECYNLFLIVSYFIGILYFITKIMEYYILEKLKLSIGYLIIYFIFYTCIFSVWPNPINDYERKMTYNKIKRYTIINSYDI